MSNLNTLFRQRIGFAENEVITFENLSQILEKTATAIPFENLCIITNNRKDITLENLVSKILLKNEGGLCYELNTILYYFLIENGFNATLAKATVFDNASQDYVAIGRTHVIILVTHNEQLYVVDTGFGGNLPLKPVPLTGELVTSFNGDFRIKKADSEQGDHILEMKLKHKDADWRIGYAFHSHQPVKDVTEMNEVQKTIIESPLSSFNKNPLITRLTTSGSLTLTDTSFTKWHDGKVMKEEIEEKQFRELAKEYFEMDV
ncbi:arylamine N-acetyltransferase [Bacillus sp. CGMCC 1.16607]|uniref:arylamine N-acetyltransferase family protein n=1 Tax=Bacillus sp. CGMCC 1.16607 TaxID=3351842 RepID=UPI00362940CD